MATDTVYVRPQESIDRIAPEIYGHFQEHLGHGVYDGIWVGEGDDRGNGDGLRTETIELLERLNPPVLRWPGGCFADDYHWEDGIGPREERPRRRNLWWLQGPDLHIEESNHFGTDEFIRFCREIDTEPYLAVNVGSGSIREAMAWMEYCNYDGDTEYADMRAENGHPEPYDVKYWGIGNENWSCGGQYDADEYGREFNHFANYLSTFNAGMLGGDDIEFIACGNADPDWNREFLDALNANSPDHLGIHYYIGKSGCGDGADFDDEDYYRLLTRSRKMEYFVERAADVINVLSPGVGVAVDEWGIWHPQASHGNGLSQENTVRDALVAASFLDIFTEHADVVSMANLAQTVNVLQCVVETDEEAAWPTPTYHVFDLYKHHMDATAVRTHAETSVRTMDDEDDDLAMVAASASLTDDRLYVTVTNRHLTEDRRIELETGLDAATDAEAEMLFDDRDVHDHSSADTRGEFESSAHAVEGGADGTLTVDLPAASIAGVTIRR